MSVRARFANAYSTNTEIKRKSAHLFAFIAYLTSKSSHKPGYWSPEGWINPYDNEPTICLIRPNEKICVFLVTGLKILGMVGTHYFLFYFFFDRNALQNA